jgi:hypothetical protein
MKLAQIIAVQLETLLEAEYFNEERSANSDSAQ